MDDDAEYKDMLKAEREAKKKKEAMNYRDAHVACCLTCANSTRMSRDDELECKLLRHERWAVNYVNEVAICNEYKP